MEIHTKADFEKVKGIPYDILGINNRDLNTFKTDISISINLYKALELDKLEVPVISESGIHNKDEVNKLLSIGFNGVLMGEHLIKSVINTGIKICGIKTPEDALYAAEKGADYIGLVFAESKRKIEINEARTILDAIKEKNIKSVAVFKDQSVNQINNILKEISVDMIQIHGKFEDFDSLETSSTVIKAFSQDDVIQMIKAHKPLISHKKVSHHLIDASIPGSGKVYNWEILNQIESNKPLFVAGGLNSQNVSELISRYHPFAVDVSSGVEQNGIKDQELINNFIINCLSADACKQI